MTPILDLAGVTVTAPSDDCPDGAWDAQRDTGPRERRHLHTIRELEVKRASTTTFTAECRQLARLASLLQRRPDLHDFPLGTQLADGLVWGA